MLSGVWMRLCRVDEAVSGGKPLAGKGVKIVC